MGLVERWNNFAKKKLYINETFQISCGRLVFTLLITLVEAVSIFILTGNVSATLPLFSNMLLSLQKQDKKKD